MKTAQEKFWEGDFGDEYISRNQSQQLLASSQSMYADVLKHAPGASSFLEFGANIGINLLAIRSLTVNAELSALEINAQAVQELSKLKLKHVYHTSLFDFQPDYPRDFVFTRGVLIHLNPDKLAQTYDILYRSSQRYICLAEYYNPSPTSVIYHGQSDRLFKRDFAGEMLDRYSDLRLTAYGFAYHRDPVFPQDDITWFLLEKNKE